MSNSIEGYTPAAIVYATANAQPVGYTYMAAITLVAYDSLISFQDEADFVYSGRQTLIKWIYTLIKSVSLVIYLLNYFAYMTPPQTPTLCWVRQWIVGLFLEIIFTGAIKILLVLRLRALYHNKKYVSVILWFATSFEIASTIYGYFIVGLDLQEHIASPSPIPGCPLRATSQLKHFRAPILLWGTKLAANGLELSLLLVGLFRSLTDASHNDFRKGWSYMKQVAPLLYIYYRDGTLFYIPICGISTFGFAATLVNFTERINCSDWEAWLAIVYYITGTRLIMNLRKAGVKFTTSVASTPKISTLAFHHEVDFDLGNRSHGSRETGSTLVAK